MAGLVQIAGWTPVGNHTRNAAVSGVVSIAPTAGADGILFQAQVKDVFITLDGQTPSATDGLQLRAGDPPVYIPQPGNTIKVIEAAASATINYQPIKFL
jgi:hypothetical protein